MRKLAISLGDKHALPREEFIPSYSGAGSIADGASGPRRPALVDVCVVHARSEPSSGAAWETGPPMRFDGHRNY